MAYSDGNSYEEILERTLANDVFANVDKRRGAISYDAVAPASLEIADVYAKLDVLDSQLFFMSATGESLDKLAVEYSVTRYAASFAKCLAEFKAWGTDSDGNKALVDMAVPVGSRFSVEGGATYYYEGKSDGYDIVACAQSGTGGNVYQATLLPTTPISGLVSAKITGLYEAARDKETDSDFRTRIGNTLKYTSFGGNIQDYIGKVNAISGVGQTKVFPSWRHKGSVLVSVVTPSFDPVSDEFLRKVKETVDPEERSGDGCGTAPIGHYVTVTTPSRMDVDISVSVESVRLPSEMQPAVEAALAEYVSSVRKSWSQDTDTAPLSILKAKVVSIVLDVSGIINVLGVSINGADGDLVLKDRAVERGQLLPYIRTVTVA